MGFFALFVDFTNAGIKDVVPGLRSPEQITVVAPSGDGDGYAPSPDCVKFCNGDAHVEFVMSP
jgi:hypothetical protein